MREHDRRFKRHAPVSIETAGKMDQVYVHCSCGRDERIATWFSEDQYSDLRTREAFNSLLLAAAHFLNARLHVTDLSAADKASYLYRFGEDAK